MYLDVNLDQRNVASRNSSSLTADVLRKAMERLRARVGIRRAEPRSVGEPITAAIEARLESIENEIDRVTRLASQELDLTRQEAFLALARDLQRNAREIRKQIRLHGG